MRALSATSLCMQKQGGRVGNLLLCGNGRGRRARRHSCEGTCGGIRAQTDRSVCVFPEENAGAAGPTGRGRIRVRSLCVLVCYVCEEHCDLFALRCGCMFVGLHCMMDALPIGHVGLCPLHLRAAMRIVCRPPLLPCSVEEFRFLRFRLDFNEYYAGTAASAPVTK